MNHFYVIAETQQDLIAPNSFVPLTEKCLESQVAGGDRRLWSKEGNMAVLNVTVLDGIQQRLQEKRGDMCAYQQSLIKKIIIIQPLF